MRSREARNVFTRLAELSVHGGNVQKGFVGRLAVIEGELLDRHSHEHGRTVLLMVEPATVIPTEDHLTGPRGMRTQ